MMELRKATKQDIDAVSRLFDQYRQFYQCPADRNLAKDFISQRINNHESTIFIAEDKNAGCIGFVQLYPSFCSVEAVKILILYDLFVDADHRKSGVGEALMGQARDYARQTGAARLDLLTAKTNLAGQRLYEKLGFHRTNEDFYAYSLTLEH